MHKTKQSIINNRSTFDLERVKRQEQQLLKEDKLVKAKEKYEQVKKGNEESRERYKKQIVEQ